MRQVNLTQICILVISGLVIVTATEPSWKVADVFKICNRSDPSIGQCIVDSLNGARETLAKGIPALNLPPLSALPVRIIDVNEGPGDFHIRAILKNGKWLGLEEYNVTSAQIDFTKPYIEFVTLIPKTLLTGPYSVDGRLIAFSIKGSGTCDVEFFDINATHRIYLEEEIRGAEKYWKVSKYIFDWEMQDCKVNYRNLFKGNKRLGDYANNLINSNWRIIVKVYEKLFKEAIGSPLIDYVNILLDKVPVKDLFLS